jgi:hypothetical protein
MNQAESSNFHSHLSKMPFPYMEQCTRNSMLLNASQGKCRGFFLSTTQRQTAKKPVTTIFQVLSPPRIPLKRIADN